LREEASFRGYTVVDPGTVLTTHLTEVLKTHMSELLSYAETKKLLDDLPAEHKKLVEELIPSQISVTGVQRVLQTLLAERVSIRDLPPSWKVSPRPSVTPRMHFTSPSMCARGWRDSFATPIFHPAVICRSLLCRRPGTGVR